MDPEYEGPFFFQTTSCMPCFRLQCTIFAALGSVKARKLNGRYRLLLLSSLMIVLHIGVP